MSVRKKLEAVDMATLDEARDKVLWGRERKSAGYSQRDREITAWHEAGHAILQLESKHADPLHKVTIIPRGRALGVTMSLPEKDILNRTKSSAPRMPNPISAWPKREPRAPFRMA